jgi:tetratricopeptide (TPR) repeat protein
MGRVMTTAEYRRQQREISAAMPLMDQAKDAILKRQFDAAEQLLDQVLAGDANCAEALFLMGYMHDLWCANRPEEAMKFYQRLAELKSNPNASFTGMYYGLRLLCNQKRWPEALAAVEEIDRAFPRLSPFSRIQVDICRDSARRELAEKGTTQPAAGASTKKERPAP